jgi:hypothetical protein
MVQGMKGVYGMECFSIEKGRSAMLVSLHTTDTASKQDRVWLVGFVSLNECALKAS